MDFKFCLLAPCSESPSLAMQKFRDDVTGHAHFGAIFSNRKLPISDRVRMRDDVIMEFLHS